MKCKIITTTRQHEVGGFSLFDSAFFEGMMGIDGALDPRDVDTITSYYDGEISVLGDEVRVCYIEDDGSGMDGVNTTVSYKLSSPDEITISRSGEVSTIMLFSRGKRTISVYQTPFMPFEVGIYASAIKNEIIDSGVLEISYIVEIKGALAQKTELKMEIKKYD